MAAFPLFVPPVYVKDGAVERFFVRCAPQPKTLKAAKLRNT